MQDQIIEFTNVLRRNGVRVSLSENIDAFRAIDLLGIEDASQFRAALRTTLVKRAIDLRPFDELFDLFFLGIGRSLNQADQQLMEQLGLSPQEFQELLDRIETEHDNLRSALNWSVENEPDTALRLVGALGSFWSKRAHWIEGRSWLERVLQSHDLGGTPDRAIALRADFRSRLGRDARSDYQRALSLAGNESERRFLRRKIERLR